MRNIIASLSLLALGVSAAQANLLVNGSFELPGIAPYSLMNPIPGWSATVDTVETGLGSIYGVTGYTGDYVLELDANSNATVEQTFNYATATTLYVSFDYAHRADALPANDGNFDVYLNGNLIASINPISTAMTNYSFTAQGLAGANTLTFVATGIANSYDGIIDNVVVTAPAPGAAIAFALGALRRRKRA